MYNQTLIEKYNFKNRIKKHPYDTILNLEEFKIICKARFLNSVICLNAPNQNDFIISMVYDIDLMESIEMIENKINEYRNKNNIDYKFYYCYFWHEPFESKEQKQKIISELNQKKLPQIYYYDFESKTSHTMQLNELHKAINDVFEFTPQQWFDKHKNDYLKQIFDADAIQEMESIFINMPNDKFKIVQPTLFDDVESYEPPKEIIQSKEHKFFEILLMNLDIFTNTENNINNYFDFLQHYYLENRENQLDVLQSKLQDITKQINDHEQTNGILQFDKLEIESIKNSIDTISYYIDDKNFINSKHIEMIEQEQKQINDLKANNPYLYDIALKQFIDENIETTTEHIKEVQMKMSNCNVVGTDENYINKNLKQFLSKTNNNVINIDVPNATTNGVYNDVFLIDIFTRNFKNIYDSGANANNNNVILSNRTKYGIVGNIQFGIETFESQKQFNFDYMALYSALVGYWMINGTKPFTTQMLYENYMNKDNIKHASVDMMQWINDAILDMAKSWFNLNGITSQNNNYNKEGFFLPIEPINNEIIINGFKYNTIEYKNTKPFNRVWHLLKAPILYDISNDNNSIILQTDKKFLAPSQNSNLPTPNINSPTVVTIRQQLTQLILGINNGTIKKREFVLRDFLTNNCHIGERSKKQIDAIKKVVKQYLDIAIENGHINTYYFDKSTKNKNYISFFINQSKKR